MTVVRMRGGPKRGVQGSVGAWYEYVLHLDVIC